jgi:3,4-dihydroxy 2-butanone 4-phosphate synthase/GTP cyclohydrolase II
MSALSEALKHLAAGGMLVLVDDEDRENEGDLLVAADFATPEVINFMAREARGLICLAMAPDLIDRLELPPMAARNETSRSTAFTVSIEARVGVSTGISASDRAQTIRTAIDPTKGRADIVTPGHIFPLRAVDGGVLVRQGHTEGSVDLARMAGLTPAAVICEIINEDGTMSRLPQLREFAARHGIPVLTIEELVAHRRATEAPHTPRSPLRRLGESLLPTEHGEFKAVAFRHALESAEHIGLLSAVSTTGVPLVRLHSECLTGDAFGSRRCDCGEQLRTSLDRLATEGGTLIYLRNHEGRGIGLGNKIRAYALQDLGMDTVEANRHLGFGDDPRDYETAALILKELGLTRIRLMTNNPRKIEALSRHGIEVIERIPLEIETDTMNASYLRTKRDRLGHRLVLLDRPGPVLSLSETVETP